MRLTLRTLLAYLDDALTAAEAREIGLKLAETPSAQNLADQIKRVTRRRGLATPPVTGEGTPSDPNTVAEYLSDTLSADLLAEYEKTCLESDVHLAEVAACHQILTLVLTEQVRVPPTARRRMYQLVKGRESIPDRRPGKAIPIGGVIEEQPAARPDDTDAGLLLGMPAYTEGEPPSRRLVRYGAVAALLAAFAFALWMAVPSADRGATEPPPVAALSPKPEVTGTRVPPPIPTTPQPAVPEPLTVDPRPSSTPAVVAAVPPPPDEPPAVVVPGKKDLVAGLTPPRQDRAAVGKLEATTGVVPIVVRKPPAADAGWVRVMPEEPLVVSTDRLMALPGYKASVRFESGVALDLWANIPDLVPAPVLETAITPWLAADGYDVDITVHAGRIYLATKKPAGAKVRIRFLNDAWEVALGDDKSEVVFELSHMVSPGAGAEPGQTTAGLAVVAGTATVKFRYGSPRTLARGDDVAWDSKGGKPDVRMNPMLDAATRASRAAYLAKVPVYHDAARARLLVQALEEFSKALTDAARVRAVFVAALQDNPQSDQAWAAARVAVFTLAALGDLPGLADALNDPNRPLVRRTAAEGLRFAFAADPATVKEFRQVLVEKSRLTDDVAESIVRLVRGLSEREQTSPDTVDRFVTGLESASVAVRELSFLNLIGYIDPQEKASNDLLRYDAGAPVEFRTPAVAAWKKKAVDVKKKLEEPPAPRPSK